MSESNVAEILEKIYLEYQMKNGRISLRSFSKIIGITSGYLSQLMNGTNSKISYDVAYRICSLTNSWELFDALNYKRPAEANQLPPEFRYRLEKATNEVNRILKERGLTGDMPEAEQIAIETFERFGFKYTSTEES